jgi:hypothetical protein
VLQSLRRCEQENDSLSFRNQQLSCRLQLLQHDLQNMQVSGPEYTGGGGGGGRYVISLIICLVCNPDGVVWLTTVSNGGLHQ